MKIRTMKVFYVCIICVFASLSWALLSLEIPHRYGVAGKCSAYAGKCYFPPVSLNQIFP
ncbi:hypothetical protein D3C85_733930 [compost metagenome]